MKNMNGKVVVITGGNSGIGYAAAQTSKESGATVIITGRREEAVKLAAARLGVTGLVSDQSSLNDVDRLAVTVSERFGKVDVLLINAGIAKFSMIETMPEAVFDDVMDLNFKGAYFTLSRFIQVLNDGASVIFLSSTSGSVYAPCASVYSASKAALNALMKTAALELAPRSIRVNAVSPGPTGTEILKKIGMNLPVEEQLLRGIPLSRLGSPDDVARMIGCLAGPEVTFITGSEFFVDGGRHINR